MKISDNPTLIRFIDNGRETLGLFFLHGQFQCYTLEDTYRSKKIYAETRIPAGSYPLRLRKEGGFHARYIRKFPKMHRGMVHIDEVPGFEWILIHIGNTRDDTAGCILLGDTANNPRIEHGKVLRSRQAYTRVYPKLADYIEAEGEDAKIEIIDIED